MRASRQRVAGGALLLVMGMAGVPSIPALASASDGTAGGGLHVRDLAVGYDHACVLITDGTVRCWGDGDEGQLGDGRAEGSRAPVTVEGLTDTVLLAAGGDHTCASLEDGTVRCWGANDDGQLGDGTRTDSPVPVAVSGLADVVSLAAGYYHTCAARADGTARCWGRNEDGQLGTEGHEDSPVPVLVEGLADACTVSVGPYGGCAIRSDRTVSCWGEVPGEPAGEPVCTTDENGSVTCTSRPPEGEAPRWRPEPMPGLEGVIGLALGDAHSCALTDQGGVRCWGRNSEGQLGDGTSEESAAPVSVADLADVRELAAGWYHTCALVDDGSVRCWGANGEGQLGDGTTRDSCPGRCGSPVMVAALAGVVEIAASSDRTCALQADGTLACWGYRAAQYPVDCPQDDCRVPIEIDLGPELDPTAPAVVTGTEASTVLDTGPRVSRDGRVMRMEGITWTGSWETSDPRLDGEVSYTGSLERFLAPMLQVETGTRTVVNDRGRWVGTSTAAAAVDSPGPGLPGPVRRVETVVLVGEGAYQGMTAYLVLTSESPARASMWGVVYPGALPPAPQPPAVSMPLPSPGPSAESVPVATPGAQQVQPDDGRSPDPRPTTPATPGALPDEGAGDGTSEQPVTPAHPARSSVPAVEPIVVDDYACLDLGTTRRAIETAGLRVGTVISSRGDADDSWLIRGQLPLAGTLVPTGSHVDLRLGDPLEPCP